MPPGWRGYIFFVTHLKWSLSSSLLYTLRKREELFPGKQHSHAVCPAEKSMMGVPWLFLAGNVLSCICRLQAQVMESACLGVCPRPCSYSLGQLPPWDPRMQGFTLSTCVPCLPSLLFNHLESKSGFRGASLKYWEWYTLLSLLWRLSYHGCIQSSQTAQQTGGDRAVLDLGGPPTAAWLIMALSLFLLLSWKSQL